MDRGLSLDFKIHFMNPVLNPQIRITKIKLQLGQNHNKSVLCNCNLSLHSHSPNSSLFQIRTTNPNSYSSSSSSSMAAAENRLVICIGDIHGFYSKLQNLWSNLESQTSPSQFSNALIIFLGDYCDRGPDTKRVIDFLISLPSKYPNQTHVFLAGNHDIAFAAFLGLLPRPLNGSGFSEGWKEYAESEDREGWYKDEGYEDMYLQGRRWAGKIRVRVNTLRGSEYKGSIFDAGPTFESYGVPHGSPELRRVVPDDHRRFLSGLVWVHEEDNVDVSGLGPGLTRARLIAVHGGLTRDWPVEEQLRCLRARDTSAGRIECLSGKRTVWDVPEELRVMDGENPTVLVSGHHGKLHIEGLRLIVDEGGGFEDRPVAAVILPSVKIVRDTDMNTDTDIAPVK